MVVAKDPEAEAEAARVREAEREAQRKKTLEEREAWERQMEERKRSLALQRLLPKTVVRYPAVAPEAEAEVSSPLPLTSLGWAGSALDRS